MGGYAALGQILGSLVGAGAQIAGADVAGKAATPSSGDQITPYYDALRNPALAGSTNDALNLIGRGNVNNEPSPIDQLIARINAMPIENKLKRRALTAISAIRESGAQGTSDPAFTRDAGFVSGGYLDNKRRSVSTVPRINELRGVLKRLGMTEDELFGTIQKDSLFKQKQSRLSSQMDGFNTRVIQDRMRAAEAANRLLGDAGAFATSGIPQSDLQNNYLNRINRGINDQEQQYLLRANFGGFQPGQGVEQFQRARTDAPMTALEQSLAAAAGITAGLGGGLEFAQQSAGQNVNSALGAAGIAASQAQAANAIRAQGALAGADAWGQGIPGAGSSIGTGLANASLLYGYNPQPPPGTQSQLYQPNLTVSNDLYTQYSSGNKS